VPPLLSRAAAAHLSDSLGRCGLLHPDLRRPIHTHFLLKPKQNGLINDYFHSTALSTGDLRIARDRSGITHHAPAMALSIEMKTTNRPKLA
jgi:hypothetical protein